jgi:hypothetical protein
MKHELLILKNVGRATYKDLIALKVYSIKQLAKEDPDELYLRLQKITGKRQDPCVLDTFAAIIHEAKTGIKTAWWEWSKIRKERYKLAKNK